jgi:hypothetical protein
MGLADDPEIADSADRLAALALHHRLIGPAAALRDESPIADESWSHLCCGVEGECMEDS